MADNAPQRLRWFSTLVPPETSGRILEIGCGNGQLLALLACRCHRAEIAGIDGSPLQVRRAIVRLSQLPAASRPVVRVFTLEDVAATLTERGYSLILAMNVNAFWTHPEQAFAAARELLAPRGRLLLAFEPPTASGRAKLRTRLQRAGDAARFELAGEYMAPDDSDGLFALVLR